MNNCAEIRCDVNFGPGVKAIRDSYEQKREVTFPVSFLTDPLKWLQGKFTGLVTEVYPVPLQPPSSAGILGMLAFRCSGRVQMAGSALLVLDGRKVLDAIVIVLDMRDGRNGDGTTCNGYGKLL